MNLLKTSLLISSLLLSNIIFANICVNTSSNYKMFGSVLRAGALVRGHEIAFHNSDFSDYQFFSAESDADLAKQIHSMTSGSCSIVLGLFTSRECLIAGPFFKNNKLIGISSSCGHDNIKRFSPYLYTAIPPISEFAKKITDYMESRNDFGKVIVIYQPTDVYSQTNFDYFKRKFTNPTIEVSVASDGQFDITKFDNNDGKKTTLVFFTYPLPSAKILMALNNSHLVNKKTLIIGASSWTFDVSVFRPIKSILEKAQAVVAADVLNWHQVKKSSFFKKFTMEYNREPLNIEILTYDVTTLAIHCYRDSLVKKKYDLNKFQTCMTRGTHQGISGPFSFNKESPFAQRPLYLSNILEKM